MLEDAAYVVQCQFRQTAVLVAGKQVLAALAQGLMHMHAVAVITHQWLGHEGRRLAEAVGDVHDGVLEYQQLVRFSHQGVEQGADLGLSGGGHLVVVHLHRDAHLFQGGADGGTDVLLGIHRGHREIAALDAGTVADVAFFEGPVAVPAALFRVDLIEGAVEIITPACVIEDKEFRFGAKEGGIGNAGGFQVFLGALGDGTGTTFVALHGGGFQHVTAQIHSGVVEERVQYGTVRIRHQDHVRLVDTLPACNGRTVKHLAVLEKAVIHHAGRYRHVLFLTAGITKP